jgi:hypothetical protein
MDGRGQRGKEDWEITSVDGVDIVSGETYRSITHLAIYTQHLPSPLQQHEFLQRASTEGCRAELALAILEAFNRNRIILQ